MTSYVSKFKEEQMGDSLYSCHVSPAMAAYRHLTDMKPLEPETVISLSSYKLTWTNNPTKRYIPPRSHNVADSVLVGKYTNRANDIHDKSLIEWLRTHDNNKVNPAPYKRSMALVGVKYISVFHVEFFFQYLLLNVPFVNVLSLNHPDHDRLPQD